MQAMWKQAKQTADGTPAERDRYVDFLRLFSIAVVVLGHWLMAVVIVRDGEVVIDHLLVAAPRMQFVTWALQVMPVFFIVGGFANAISWEAARSKGHSYGIWLQARTARLLRPTMIFAAVWAAAAFVLMTMGVDPELLKIGTQVVAVPLWFLAVYVGVVVLAPIMIALDRRFGWALPVGLLAAAGFIDWLHHGLSVPVIGWVNFLFVWLGIHQLGVRWQRGTMPKRTTSAMTLAAAGLLGLIVLTTAGPYPVSMVGVPGSAWTNNLPPTIALMMLAIFQTGVMLALRKRVSKWLERPTVWAAVIIGNGRIMTIYLWHMTSMVGVFGLGLWSGGIGFGLEPLGAAWWWSRLAWFIVLLIPLTALIATFGRFEQARLSRPSTALAVGLGVMAVIWGFARLALNGFITSGLAGVAIVPAAAVVLGSWLLGVRPLNASFPFLRQFGAQSAPNWRKKPY